MLKHNRCDYLLNYSGPMKNMLKQVPIDALNKSRVSTLEARFVVSKKTPNAQQVLQNLVTAYDELVSEGMWPPQ